MSGAYYKLANQERENHVRMFYVWKRTSTREFYSRMVWQWWKNGWTSFPSRSQGPFHYQNFIFKNIFDFFQKYFWIFFYFSNFFELGWNSKKKILVRELNEPLKCQICSGYLINPTVVNECQHTFCKTVSKYVSIDQPTKL